MIPDNSITASARTGTDRATQRQVCLHVAP
jgi:hypothetical protein